MTEPRDQPFERCDPGFVFLDQVGSLRIIVERALLIFADLDADQVARDIVVLSQAVQCLAGDELLRDLAFELDAVTAVLCHGFSLRKPGRLVNPHIPICPPSGAHSNQGSKFGAD